MTLKVGFVCQWFPPEPVTVPPGIARALASRGAEVEVLTGVPNYPTGEVRPGYRASRSLTEDIDGVSVHRTPLYPSHDAKSIRRFLNYGSWALSSAVLGVRHLRDKDVTLVYSSPATSALAALVAERLFRVPYVLLIQDLWPDSVVASGMVPRRVAGLVERVLSVFVSLTYRRAARIAVISPGMVDALVARGVPSEKIDLIYNWVDRQPDAPARSDRPRWRRRLGIADEDFVLMYAGNHGAAQSLGSVIEGMGLLSRDRTIHLLMVGDGIEKARLVERAAIRAPGTVHFVDPVPSNEMPELMAAADAQLVSLADRPLFSITTPSKLQSTLASGQPVLAAARGDVARIVEGAQAGLVVEPESPRQFADAVERLAGLSADDRSAMGRRGRDYYRSHMDVDVGAERLMATLESAARRQGIRVEKSGDLA